MSEGDIRPPDGGDGAIEEAIVHIREAEHDLAEAHEGELRAEHELERAVEEPEHAKHDKVEWIVVNGRRKEVDVRRISFEEVVALAFSTPPTGAEVQFTIQYTRGPEHKPSGTLVEGQSVKVKNGMEFDVTPTNRS